mmetsp:Transcript_116748/g.341805  ORF Transcript_116748/g.341805 Transcript_116748/m.341805 type:complete len:214 (+) Transcript_116748:373-1014(+)
MWSSIAWTLDDGQSATLGMSSKLRSSDSRRSHSSATFCASSSGPLSMLGLKGGLPGANSNISQSMAVSGKAASNSDLNCALVTVLCRYFWMYDRMKGSKALAPPTFSCKYSRHAAPFTYGTTEKASSGSRPPVRSGTSLVKLWSSPNRLMASRQHDQRFCLANAACSGPRTFSTIFISLNTVRPSFSQKSSQVWFVTKLPLQECAISCATTET